MKAAFQRKVLRVLFRERARWPELLVVVSDASEDVVLEERPAHVGPPRAGHVWFRADRGPCVQFDVITAGRAAGLR